MIDKMAKLVQEGRDIDQVTAFLQRLGDISMNVEEGRAFEILQSCFYSTSLLTILKQALASCSFEDEASFKLKL